MLKKSLTILKLLFFLLFLINNQTNAHTTIVKQIRVLKQFTSVSELECSIPNSNIRIDQIKWLNEITGKFQDNPIINEYNLIQSGQSVLTLRDNLYFVSCGYLQNNMYVRLDAWQVTYIDNPSTDIQISNTQQSNYQVINNTHSYFSLINDFNTYDWSREVDLLRIKCQNNFELPRNKRFVWMYVINSSTKQQEIWHKYDLDLNENIYQMFSISDSVSNVSLSKFLKNFYTQQNYQIELQCASYFEQQQIGSKICLLASSKNITLILNNKNPNPNPIPEHQTGSNINLPALIGGIIGGILGLLLLLSLLFLIIWCCCCGRTCCGLNCFKQRKRRETDVQSTTVIYPVQHVDGSNSFTNINTVNNSSNHISNINTTNNNHVSMIDQGSQFSNQIEIGLERNQTALRTIAPDVYLNVLTIHKDPIEEDSCSYFTNRHDAQNLSSFTDDYHHQLNHQHHQLEQQQQQQQQETRFDYYSHSYREELKNDVNFNYL